MSSRKMGTFRNFLEFGSGFEFGPWALKSPWSFSCWLNGPRFYDVLWENYSISDHFMLYDGSTHSNEMSWILPCFTSGGFIKHILPSLILRQRTVSAVQTDSSAVCVHAAVARIPTQKEVWNPLGSPASLHTPHPASLHNQQMSHGLPAP